MRLKLPKHACVQRVTPKKCFRERFKEEIRRLFSIELQPIKVVFLGAHAPQQIAPVSQSQNRLKQHHKLEITGFGPVWFLMAPY